MFTSASKVVKSAPAVQHKAAAGATFFRKAGEQTFFRSKESPSFFGKPIQAKLTVSTPDDPQEKEADAVADKVMRTPEPVAAVSTVPEKKEELHRKEEKEEEIQAKEDTPVSNKIQCKEEPDEKLHAKSGIPTITAKPPGHKQESITPEITDNNTNRTNISLYHSVNILNIDVSMNSS